MIRLDDLLNLAARQLRAAGIEDAPLEARLLFEHCSGMGRTAQLLHGSDAVDATTHQAFLSLLAPRVQRQPLQYLTGSQSFWSFDLHVSPAVLIPRPETEFLLEQVLDTCIGQHIHLALDLCTGSGAIALVLAKELGCQVVASDLSQAALQVAQHNARQHGFGEQIGFVSSDLLSGLQALFDLIVTNPPYVVEAEIDTLQPEVARAEPRLALSGGADGLDCIRRIIDDAPAYLRPGGWLFMEIGADQQQAVSALLHGDGHSFDQISILVDYAGRPRVARARRATPLCRDTSPNYCTFNN